MWRGTFFGIRRLSSMPLAKICKVNIRKFPLNVTNFSVFQCNTKSLALPKISTNQIIISKPILEDDIFILSKNLTYSSQKEDEKLPEDELKKAQILFCDYSERFFFSNLQEEIFHPDILLENKISNKIIRGISAYKSYLNGVKLYGHFRYVTVNSQVISSHINYEEQSVTIQIRFSGLGYLETAILFIPKKLWKPGNYEKESRPWFEAVSVYYLNKQGQVVRHVLDDKNIDQDRVVKNPIDRLREKILQRAPIPAPSLYK